MEIHINVNPGPRHIRPSGDPNKQASPGVLIGLGIFSLLIVGVVTWVTMGGIAKQKTAHNTYKPVAADVVESHVESHLKSSSHKSHGTGITINGDGNRTYSAVITYRYAVDGQSYTSKRYWYEGGGTNSETGANALAAQYAAGAHVTAYYDPANPAEAVLNNAAPDEGLIMGALGVLWFGTLFIFAKGIAGLRAKRL